MPTTGIKQTISTKMPSNILMPGEQRNKLAKDLLAIDPEKHHEVLGIAPDADAETVLAAYKKLSKKLNWTYYPTTKCVVDAADRKSIFITAQSIS